jgi:hypothetical protein
MISLDSPELELHQNFRKHSLYKYCEINKNEDPVFTDLTSVVLGKKTGLAMII